VPDAERRPPARQRLDRDGVSWSYTEAGSGPVVVLLHGLAADATSWSRLADLLARDHRVISLDLPGYSLTGDSGEPLAPGLLAQLLNSMLGELVPTPAQITLVGHSFGASVAMMAANYAPERYLALVLIAPGGFGIEVSPVLSVLSTRPGMAAVRVLHTRVLSRTIHRAADRIARVQTERPAYSLDGVMQAYERLANPATRDQLRRAAKQVLGARRAASPAAAGALPAQVPVLIVWGSHDHVLPAWHADTARKLLPWSDVEIVEHAGHTPHQTHAGEVMTRVGRFLGSPAVRERSRKGDAAR
jgi:pimeloyl-ACP methyl ester carboxylesterase